MGKARIPEGSQAVYHGGRRKIRKINPSLFQRRDPGFYGEGFYVTAAPHYARSYGPVVSMFRWKPDVSILDASLKPDEAPEDLVEVVIRHTDRKHRTSARRRGKEEAFEEELGWIKTNPLAWKNAVYGYAKDLNFDAVAFSRGEIVVLNPDALIFVE